MGEQLAERLAALDADVTRQVRITTPAQIRARGDRHRAQVAAMSAGTVVAITSIGIGVAAHQPGRPVGSPPAGGLSIDISGAPVPAGSLPVNGPPVSGPPVTARPVLHTKIGDVRLPREGDAGWRADTNPEIAAVFGGCGAGDLTRVGRTDARTATGPGWPGEEAHSPTVVTEQLFLFASEQTAIEVSSALVEQALACGWSRSMNEGELNGSRSHGTFPAGSTEHVAAVRVVNAIFLIHSETTGSRMSSVGSYEPSLMAARLCAAWGYCSPEPWVSPIDGQPWEYPNQPATGQPATGQPAPGQPASGQPAVQPTRTG